MTSFAKIAKLSALFTIDLAQRTTCAGYVKTHLLAEHMIHLLDMPEKRKAETPVSCRARY